MSAFKSTHLSATAAPERIAGSMLPFSFGCGNKNKGPHLLVPVS